MMSPEIMRAAADMMKNMRPEDLETMQRQMQNLTPDQMQQMQRMMPNMGGMGAGPNPAMAAEMMRNMKAEDLQFMARQMEGIPPEQMQRMMSGQMGAGAGPGAGVGMGMGMLQQRQKYELDAAVRLKEEGNKLHGAGQYERAADKYERARSNLTAHSSPEAAATRKACTLNLMSCNLKLGKHTDAVKLGDEIVAQDSSNLKALYRRGQAHLKLGQLEPAVQDLARAAQISPEDETLAGVLREAREELARTGALPSAERQGEGEGSQERESRAEAAAEEPAATNGVIIEDVTEEDEEDTPLQNRTRQVPPQAAAPSVDPTAVRGIQLMSQMSPDQIAALSGGALTPETAAMASRMVSCMPPEELQRMMQMAARFNPAAAAGRAPPASPFGGGVPPVAVGGAGAAASSTMEGGRDTSLSGAGVAPAPSAAVVGFPGASPFGAFPGGKNPMEDPQMMKTMAEMMKGVSPEDLAAMSQQMGNPMTVEQARQTKEIMSRVAPETLATVMKWTTRAQGAWQQAQLRLRWLLRQRTLLLAILVVLVAVIGRWLGWF